MTAFQIPLSPSFSSDTIALEANPDLCDCDHVPSRFRFHTANDVHGKDLPGVSLKPQSGHILDRGGDAAAHRFVRLDYDGRECGPPGAAGRIDARLRRLHHHDGHIHLPAGDARRGGLVPVGAGRQHVRASLHQCHRHRYCAIHYHDRDPRSEDPRLGRHLLSAGVFRRRVPSRQVLPDRG